MNDPTFYRVVKVSSTSMNEWMNEWMNECVYKIDNVTYKCELVHK